MFIWKLFKRWRSGRQKKKKYQNVLGESLRFKFVNPAAQEKRRQKKRALDALVISRHYNPEEDQRYHIWVMLSRREQHVTALTCLGYTNPQIATRLGLSIETVRSYLDNVFHKSRVRSKADLRVFFAPWDFSEFEQIDAHH
jgi:DNA-binding NarL/FixJ family response regulator